MAQRRRVSALYLPASNPRAVAKARTIACDVVILDLEDAVAPEAKPAAREAVADALSQGDFGGSEVVVRVNALSTPWGADDCAMLAKATPGAVLLPKVDDAASIAPYAQLLGANTLWAMVETARSVLRIEDLASAPGLAALVLGTNDLVKELGMRPDPQRVMLSSFLAQTIAAARAYGLSVLDGVFNALDDDEGFTRECRQASDFGFDGKTLIHPRQVDLCHAAFAPSEDEVERARVIVAAFAAPENAAKGALRVEGQMVERLHLEQAERTLAAAENAGGGGDRR